MKQLVKKLFTKLSYGSAGRLVSKVGKHGAVMSIGRAIHHAVRAVLEAKGYWVRHRSVLPYGVDYQHDISRLSNIFGISVNIFFDVGANTGQTSSAALVNFPGATIFAFEPHKPIFLALKNNVWDPRVRPFNLALSDKRGEARFFEYDTHGLSNSMVEDSQYAVYTKHPPKTLSVECETLDGICKTLGIDQIDVLKVDTEGHDLAVLRGAERMLAERRIRFVYIEFNTMQPKAGTSGGALLPISGILEPLGFRFVASYTEQLMATGELFVQSNALFVHLPSAKPSER